MRFEQTNNDEKIVFELHPDSSLDEVLEAFERFLRAASFTIPYDKHLDLVDND